MIDISKALNSTSIPKMRIVWQAAGFVTTTIGSSIIECNLEVSHMDDLLTIPVLQSDDSVRNLIIDTGASGAIFFDPSTDESTSSGIDFQQTSIGDLRPHSQASLSCSPAVQMLTAPVSGRPRFPDLFNVADGILGLGGRGFKSYRSFLFDEHAPKWSTVSITVPSELKKEGRPAAKMIITTSALRNAAGSFVPVISDYYWAAGADGMKIGTSYIQHPSNMAIIFDTGSNHFGASPGMIDIVTKAIKANGCKDPLVLELSNPKTGKSVHVSFRSEDYALDEKCNELAIAQIDQSRFGDLSGREVLIVGTRGLRSKTISLYRGTASMNADLYLSVDIN
jgi:hypothetical protein